MSRDPGPSSQARRLLGEATRGDWLRVQARFALRPERVAHLLRAGRPPAAILESGIEGGVAGPSASRVARWEERLDERAIGLLPLPALLYPESLRELVDAPPVLAMRGDEAALRAPAVAIVGSRAATRYGRAVARELASNLARAGLAIVSGLARGIDAEAHRGALDAGGRTIAVLGCGPDRVYPREHAELARELAENGGLVLSEFPLGTPPRAPYFPLRNRIISALSKALVVVEARERSGSLVSARHAAQQGVDVFAVPGLVTSPAAAGSNRLLFEGAGVARGAGDVLGALGIGVLDAAREQAEAAGTVGLDGDLALVHSTLRDEALDPDELLRRTGLDAARVASALLELELEGWARRERDGRWWASGRPRSG